MQSLEAILSLLFLISIVSPLLIPSNGNEIDDSLYRIQLAEDIWRVLYLRGDFHEFGDTKRTFIETEFELIGDETDLCIFMDGIEFTNCRGGEQEHELSASLPKTIIYEGRPKSVSFSIGK